MNELPKGPGEQPDTLHEGVNLEKMVQDYGMTLTDLEAALQRDLNSGDTYGAARWREIIQKVKDEGGTGYMLGHVLK